MLNRCYQISKDFPVVVVVVALKLHILGSKVEACCIYVSLALAFEVIESYVSDSFEKIKTNRTETNSFKRINFLIIYLPGQKSLNEKLCHKWLMTGDTCTTSNISP